MRGLLGRSGRILPAGWDARSGGVHGLRSQLGRLGGARVVVIRSGPAAERSVLAGQYTQGAEDFVSRDAVLGQGIQLRPELLAQVRASRVPDADVRARGVRVHRRRGRGAGPPRLPRAPVRRSDSGAGIDPERHHIVTRTITAPEYRGTARATLTALAVAAVFLVPAAQAESTAECAPDTTGVCKAGSPHPAGATAECKDGTHSYAEKFRGTCSAMAVSATGTSRHASRPGRYCRDSWSAGRRTRQRGQLPACGQHQPSRLTPACTPRGLSVRTGPRGVQ